MLETSAMRGDCAASPTALRWAGASSQPEIWSRSAGHWGIVALRRVFMGGPDRFGGQRVGTAVALALRERCLISSLSLRYRNAKSDLGLQTTLDDRKKSLLIAVGDSANRFSHTEQDYEEAR